MENYKPESCSDCYFEAEYNDDYCKNYYCPYILNTADWFASYEDASEGERETRRHRLCPLNKNIIVSEIG